MQCTLERCPAYHDESLQCMWGMFLHRQLGVTDLSTVKTTAEPSAPIVDAMKSDTPFPELKPRSFLPSIAGRITTPIEVREVTTGSGPTPLANFDITDGVAIIKVTIWEPGSTLDAFKVGSWITLTNLSVKEYQGETQISSTRKTKISR